jgi:hypothetical protein
VITHRAVHDCGQIRTATLHLTVTQRSVTTQGTQTPRTPPPPRTIPTPPPTTPPPTTTDRDTARPSGAEAVRTRIAGFERALVARRADEVASYFATPYLERNVKTVLVQRYQRFRELLESYRPVLAERGVDENTPPEVRTRTLLEVIPPAQLQQFDKEWRAFNLALAGRDQQALRAYLADVLIPVIFRNVQGVRIEDITSSTETSAVLRVAITMNHKASIWSLQLVMEQGELRISSLQCLRDCS